MVAVNVPNIDHSDPIFSNNRLLCFLWFFSKFFVRQKPYFHYCDSDCEWSNLNVVPEDGLRLQDCDQKLPFALF